MYLKVKTISKVNVSANAGRMVWVVNRESFRNKQW